MQSTRSYREDMGIQEALLDLTFEVEKGVLYPTGRYQDMYHRGMRATANHETIDRAIQATEGGANISHQALKGVGADILRLDGNVGRKAGIVHGFGESRHAFTIVARDAGVRGVGGLTYVLSGYTAAPEASEINGMVSFSDQTQFYINNIMICSSQMTRDPLTGAMIPQNQPLRSLKVVYDHASCGYGTNEEISFTSRPEDIAMALGMIATGQAESIGSQFGGAHNSSSMLSTPTLSNHANEIPSRYLADTASSYVNSCNAALSDMVSVSDAESDQYIEQDVDRTTVNVFNGMRSNLTNHAYAKMMTNLERMLRLDECWSNNGFLTLDGMMALFPNLMHVIRIPTMDVNQLTQVDDFCPWTVSGPEATMAQTLVQTVPAMMNMLSLDMITVTITNQVDVMSAQTADMGDYSSTGTFMHNQFLVVTERAPRSIIPMHNGLMQIARVLFQNIIDELLMPMSEYGQYPLTIALDMDLATEATTIIDFHGTDGEYRFRCPTFASGTYSRMIVNNQESLTRNAIDLRTVVSDIGGSVSTAVDNLVLNDPAQQRAQGTPAPQTRTQGTWDNSVPETVAPQPTYFRF